MSVIKINVSNVISSGSTANSAKNILSSDIYRIRIVGTQIDARIRSSNNISNRIERVCSNLKQAEKRIDKLKTVVDKCASEYRKADLQVKKMAEETAAFPKADTSGKSSVSGSLLEKLLKNQWKIQGSVIGGTIVKNGSLLGFDTSGTLKGDVLGGSIKTESVAKWNPGKGDARLEKSIKAEGHLAQGEVAGSIGLLSKKITGTVGSVGATGKVGVSLFKDGKLSPSVEAKLKAEVAALKGNAEVKFGNEKNNVHLKGSGTLFGAAAEASGSAGVIRSVDPNTNEVKTEYGIEGKVGAEAYVAQGTVSGGFTLFGVKIDASLTGKAGGAGVSAGGKATTGGVSGKIGAGLGVGAGIEINIDWSGLFS